MNIEQTVKEVFNKVLDIAPEEITPDAKLDKALGIDSTKMVENAESLKKRLGIKIGNNELKKTHSFNEIVGILKSKGAKVDFK